MEWQATLIVVLFATMAGGIPRDQCLSDNNSPSEVNVDLSGITDFGLDLYRKLSPANSGENFFFSPYSIWSVLALTYLGTAGNTKTELERALRVTDKTSTQRLLSALKLVYLDQGQNPNYSFEVANRIYYDSDLTLRACIQNILPNELKKVSFKDTVSTANAINDFVSSTTSGRIDQIVTPSDLNDLVMMLVNAAYFKGTWVYQFNPNNTIKAPFFLRPHESIPVDMMRLKSKLRYGVSEELKAEVLDVPYAGGDVSMILLLPQEEGPQGFDAMIRAMSGARLRQVIENGLRQTRVELHLPRFRQEHTIKSQLITALQAIGVRDLFDIRSADLSDFVLFTPLYVSKAVHKAFVEVNEKGTEAAAATALGVAIRSGHSKESLPVPFICNRPFIFIIHENYTKNVLFMGAYKN